ncbi:MAG: hypothetical protein FWE70_06495 [Oscillospiraceae bacterium]|nr:hypothetical protein [Oscillospiraceae bacterium]
MYVSQLSVFVENSSGRLYEVVDAIGKAGLNVHAMSIADTSDFGILRFIVDDPGRASEVLRGAGYVSSLTEVVAVPIEDRPGGLARVLRILSEAGVGIEYLYAFMSHGKGSAYVILRVGDNALTVRALGAHGIKAVGQDGLRDL